mmetsp:Transcript_24727/g.37581  ORF Transcript_24727/g.37581 Transcript_24727/m.37581 type:complete len:339 (+) Transcript_24727:435-1451(+)
MQALSIMNSPLLLLLPLSLPFLSVITQLPYCQGFLQPSTIPTISSSRRTTFHINNNNNSNKPSSSSSSQLQVWWFGGNSGEEPTDEESCELVPVRIERTSANSRKIAGEIIVDNASLDSVWSILTDYDRLATHVPNLIQSRIVSTPPAAAGSGSSSSSSRPGDGTYNCRLYQQGAQKIVGFQFGADVTMEMQERILVPPKAKAAASDNNDIPSLPQQRQIAFKCVDSFFFTEFDGFWLVTELNENETKLTYTVDVRPKGPVPVAALEWRIREDVPTNLRAVKKAASLIDTTTTTTKRKSSSSSSPLRSRLAQNVKRGLTSAAQSMIWQEDETMAAYLK